MNEKNTSFNSSDSEHKKEENKSNDTIEENFLDESIDKKIIVYPFKKITYMPMITKSNKELCFLYFSENDN